MRLGCQVACICLLGIFVPALITSLGYSLTDAPGPGFFPFWLSLIGVALTAYWCSSRAAASPRMPRLSFFPIGRQAFKLAPFSLR